MYYRNAHGFNLLYKVVTYLAGCGLQMCPMLLSKGYPDIGWNPCGGERYLDFLRFAVFVNGQCSLLIGQKVWIKFSITTSSALVLIELFL